MPATAKELLKNIDQLPVIPVVVVELLSSFQDANAPIEKIVNSLKMEPVLSAKVLRLANSAFFHRAREISSLEDAVLLIGFQSLKTLVLGASAAVAVRVPPGLDGETFWTHGVTTAAAGRMLAETAIANGAQDVSSDLVFTVGLIQSIGDLLIRTALPIETFSLDAQTPHCDECRAEQQIKTLGYCFADVTAALAEGWRFPRELCDALAQQSSSQLGLVPSRNAQLVAIAARLASARMNHTVLEIEDHRLQALHLKRAELTAVYSSTDLDAMVEPLRDAMLQ